MQAVILVLQILILIAVAIAMLLARRYIPKYVDKKAENLATKEDIAEITAKTEQARLPYVAAAEQLRSELQGHSAALTRRQELYIALAESSADAFLAGRGTSPEQKARFLACYSAAFLHTPPAVIAAINAHLDLQVRVLRDENKAALQPDLQRTFAELMVILRREGFADEGELDASSYRFVSF
jgi:hypothetical protein